MTFFEDFTAALALIYAQQGPERAPTDIPTLTIGVDVHGRNVDVPLVGAGTWLYNETTAYQSVCKAFLAGYTFVDTAYGYNNQRGVHRAIRDCWTDGGGLSRDDLFIMTKIPGGLTMEESLEAHAHNLLDLGLSYVDHLMVHYPADWSVSPDRSTPERRREEWRALEMIYYMGQARSIGVSHYCPRHIDDVLSIATVRPSINQVEYHVGSGDVDGVLEKCRSEKITFMSFSPLCGPCTYAPENSLINGKLVTDIGRKYGVSGSQVSLRFIIQQALKEGSYVGPVIPKSNDPKHIASNRDIFSFNLSEEDMRALGDAVEPAGEPGDCDVP